MEIQRSASGDLLLRPPVGERIGEGSLALFMFLMTGYALLEGNRELGFISNRLAGAALLILFVAFVALGVWLVRRERIRFDHRKRIVERNRKVFCRYEDVQELLIEVRFDEEAVHYRMKLLLRSGRGIPVGSYMTEEDEANDAARRIASELGVSARVVR